MENLYNDFFEAGRLMASLPYETGDARLFLETDDGVYATKRGANLAELTEDDIIKLKIFTLPLGQKDSMAMVFSQTPKLQECIAHGASFFASLDDMAQIIGPVFYVINGSKGDYLESADMVRVTKFSNACLVATEEDEEKKELKGFTMTSGRTLTEAITALTVLEKSADVAMLADRISFSKQINLIHVKIMQNVYKKKYSKPRIGGFEHQTLENIDEREMQLREQVVDYGNKLVEKGLVQGTWGNLSVRLDDKYMLVTPSGIDYDALTPADIVKVEIATLNYEGGLKPTSEKTLHAELYKARPDVSAIVHTHSTYCSAFASALAAMPIKSDADQKIFGKGVMLAKYWLPSTAKLGKYVKAAMGDNFGVIMAHHGMAACGKDMETAFDNAVRLEANAKSLLDSAVKKH